MESDQTEASIRKIIYQYPGCVPGRFSTKECQYVQSMVADGKVVVRYNGLMPHYYLPHQPPTYNLRYIITEAESKIRKHQRMIDAAESDIRYEEGVIAGIRMALEIIESDEVQNDHE